MSNEKFLDITPCKALLGRSLQGFKSNMSDAAINCKCKFYTYSQFCPFFDRKYVDTHSEVIRVCCHLCCCISLHPMRIWLENMDHPSNSSSLHIRVWWLWWLQLMQRTTGSVGRLITVSLNASRQVHGSTGTLHFAHTTMDKQGSTQSGIFGQKNKHLNLSIFWYRV